MKALFFSPLGVVFLAGVWMVSGCLNRQKDFSETPGGLTYRFHEQSRTGDPVLPGDMITAEVTFRTDDTVFFISSRDLSVPYQFEILEPQFPGDIYEALMLMGKGDSATFRIKGDSLFLLNFGASELPGFIRPGTLVYMDVRLIDVMPAEAFAEHKSRYGERVSTMNEERQTMEQAAIKLYLDTILAPVTVSETGLCYIELKNGEGKPVQTGKEITVDYSAMFISGEIFETTIRQIAMKNNIFDSSMRFVPFRFIQGDTLLIPGWTEGLAYMREGGRGRLVLPSALAYAEHGVKGLIPPYMPLVYEIEVLKVD